MEAVASIVYDGVTTLCQAMEEAGVTGREMKLTRVTRRSAQVNLIRVERIYFKGHLQSIFK